MHKIRWMISVATLVAFAGCDSAPGEKVDAADLDVADADASYDDCHVDCFGGWSCFEGSVYHHVSSPMPCTELGLRVCLGTSIYACTSGTCDGEVDARYAQCLTAASRRPRWDGIPEELAKLACEEGKPKLAGDACASDEDCRPAAESVTGALTCDTEAGECVEASRPAAPEGYGDSCGLALGSVSAGQELAEVETCELCHVRRDDEAGCVRQACTIACTFDEDCPTGSICLCPSAPAYTSATGFCAEATDRSTSEGREAWLACPPA